MTKFFLFLFLTGLVPLGISGDEEDLSIFAFEGAQLSEDSDYGLNGAERTSVENEMDNIKLEIKANKVTAYWIKYTDLFSTYENPQWSGVEKWSITLPPGTKSENVFVHLDHNGKNRIEATRNFAVIYVNEKIFTVVDQNSGKDLKAEYFQQIERNRQSAKKFDDFFEVRRGRKGKGSCGENVADW